MRFYDPEKEGFGQYGRRGGMYNMPRPSPYAPVNQGGPGNPGGANNMPSGPNTKPAAPEGPWLKPPAPNYDGSGINPQMPQLPMPDEWHYPGNGQRPPRFGGGPRDDFMPSPRDNMQRPQWGRDPYGQFGGGAQSQFLGRYRPPMMSDPNNPGGGWLENQGPYSYNIPNSYGSGQWNQFNSTDRAGRNFGRPQFGPQPGYSPRDYLSQQGGPMTSVVDYLQGYANQLFQQPKPGGYTMPGTVDQQGPTG